MFGSHWKTTVSQKGGNRFELFAFQTTTENFPNQLEVLIIGTKEISFVFVVTVLAFASRPLALKGFVFDRSGYSQRVVVGKLFG
ncbi:MAG: hypothetical protein V1664_00035 [Candidatus Uhrbacteria bacterium]